MGRRWPDLVIEDISAFWDSINLLFEAYDVIILWLSNDHHLEPIASTFTRPRVVSTGNSVAEGLFGEGEM